MASSSLLGENKLSPYQGIEMVAETGIEPIPSVSETEALYRYATPHLEIGKHK